MIDGLLVLTLLSVAAVLACFRFVGCAQVLGLEPWKDPEKPPAPPDYGGMIIKDDTMVAYWRLGDPTASPGVTAKDERNAHNGTYQSEVLMASPFSAAAAGVLLPGQPGLLATAPTQTSVNVDGGYVKVDFNLDLALNPAPEKSFSVEAWVVPEWSVTETDIFRCVVASRDDTGATKHGYILYAGPKLNPTTLEITEHPSFWQAWVGNGSDKWVMLQGPKVEAGQTTYLLLTYDGMAQTLTLDAITNPGPDTVIPPRLSMMPVLYNPNLGKPLYIGMGGTEIVVPPGQPLYPFRGRLQEIAFYGTALTTDQVANHVKEGAGS